MERNTQARVLAAAVLLGALAVGGARHAGWLGGAGASKDVLSAEDAIASAIYANQNAARSGDVNRYLAGYTEPMRSELRRSLEESGEAEFARYLRQSTAAMKGFAVRVETASEQQATARVERVFQDRNDAQVVWLQKQGREWRIARTEGDQTFKAAIRYGTPVR
jgi:hypothetical protein